MERDCRRAECRPGGHGPGRAALVPGHRQNGGDVGISEASEGRLTETSRGVTDFARWRM